MRACVKMYLNRYFSRDFGTSDDYIGTIYLPVAQLSGEGGNGICYITFCYF